MKQKFLLFALMGIMAGAVMTACNKDKDEGVDLKNTTLVLTSKSDGSVTTIEFTSATEFTGNKGSTAVSGTYTFVDGTLTLTFANGDTITLNKEGDTFTSSEYTVEATKEGEDKPSGTTTNEYVVINGVKWATCNVDSVGTFAASPEAPGKLYQWNRKKGWPVTGEVSGWNSLTPTGDNWEAANDPSPAGWRVPTKAEQISLLDETKVTSKWVTTPTNGRLFTDKATNKTLFLPAVGARSYNSDGTPYGVGTEGRYWSSSNYNEYNAYNLYFDSDDADWKDIINHNSGFSVRSVAVE